MYYVLHVCSRQCSWLQCRLLVTSSAACCHSDNDINEMDIPQPFVVERDRFGKLVHRELKPNGRNETVTNENKEEYVRSAAALYYTCT